MLMSRMKVERWRGIVGMSVHSTVTLHGKMRKDFCPHFSAPRFLESIYKGGSNEGCRKLIPVFHNLHRKGRSSLPAMALTLKYLVRVSSKASLHGREKTNKLGSTFSRPVNIFYAIIKSPRSLRRCED